MTTSSLSPLRKGDRGPRVKALQEALIKVGFPLTATDYFGPKTYDAVRTFQRKNTLIPDGVAGAKTLTLLEITLDPAKKAGLPHCFDFIGDIFRRFGAAVANAAHAAKQDPPPAVPAMLPKTLQISQDGLRFIYTREAWENISNYLHWPGGTSGVTLGPGYDMKERSQEVIIRDITAVGLDSDTAKKIAEASGLSHAKAKQFAKDNHSVVELTSQQEMQLLVHIAPDYVNMVKNSIIIPLLQQEFDALVCFAYNPGGRFKTVAHHINCGRVPDAMAAIKQAITSDNKVEPGLIIRRDLEVSLYLYGKYGHLRG